MKAVYITKLAKYLPYDPVNNDEMETYLGYVDGKPSKVRRLILRNNGIQTRYYAFGKDRPTLTNAQMTANAITLLTKDTLKQNIGLLACGTTSPDQTLPGHAAMVQGELKWHPQEVVSFAGACNTSMSALKYAVMSVRTGQYESAIATGSERMSLFMKGDKFKAEIDKIQEIENDGYIAFEKDFLRWMLSDGAAAGLITDQPNVDSFSFRVEWLESISFANELETCMYAGAVKNEDGTLKGYNEIDTQDWLSESVFAVKQDTKLLGENIVPKGTAFLMQLLQKYNLDITTIDWFLPHLSSNFFKDKIKASLEAHQIDIPYEKWFMNLTKVGNVGAASVFLMLEELMNDHTSALQPGQKILVMVPESARFSYSYALLTVV